MSNANYYIQQTVSQLNNPHASLAQLIAELGGKDNPSQDDYEAAAKIAVTNPQLDTIASYLQRTGAEGDYVYKQEDIKKILDENAAAAQSMRAAELDQSNAAYNRNMATAQDTAMDTIRSQTAQAIQAGINKGMQNANMLSTIIGNSQAANESAQKNAEARINAANQYYADLAKNGETALTQGTNNMNTLLGNIRQLYNDDIQQKTADLEYNASLEETLANYLANRYTADTNYANNVNSVAGGIYNNNQSSLAGLISAAIAAEAQDNYTEAYANAQAAQTAAYSNAQAAANAAAARASAERSAISNSQNVLAQSKASGTTSNSAGSVKIPKKPNTSTGNSNGKGALSGATKLFTNGGRKITGGTNVY